MTTRLEPVAEPVSNRYKLVPVAPTLAMIEKAVDNCGPVGCCLIEPDHAQEIWSAMLAAAPAPEGMREDVLERLRALDFGGHYDEARFQQIADDILAIIAKGEGRE